MDVIILDATHQRFNNVTYRKNKRGWYQTAVTTLHRAVWEYHFGKIPKGYEIHHVDGDKANNQLDNLQLMTTSEHRRFHAQANSAKRPVRSFECQRCGASFQSTAAVANFCPTCRAERERERDRAKRATRKVVKPFKPRRFRTCVICGKPFELDRKPDAHSRKTCSKGCHDKLIGKLPVRLCAICGKEFKPVHSRNVCCSSECGAKYNGLQARGKPRVLKRLPAS